MAGAFFAILLLLTLDNDAQFGETAHSKKGSSDQTDRKEVIRLTSRLRFSWIFVDSKLP